MPHYDYECENCKHQVLDVQQSMKDDPLTKCPECKKNKLSRIVTGGLGFTYKAEATTIGQLAEREKRTIQDDGQMAIGYTYKKDLRKKYNILKKRHDFQEAIKNVDPKDRKKWIEKERNKK